MTVVKVLSTLGADSTIQLSKTLRALTSSFSETGLFYEGDRSSDLYGEDYTAQRSETWSINAHRFYDLILQGRCTRKPI
jgi:hypothetical protein